MKKMRRTRFTAQFLLMVMLLNLWLPVMAFASPDSGEEASAQQALAQGGDWLKAQNGDFSTRTMSSDFDAFILARLDKMDGPSSKNYYDQLEKYVLEHQADLIDSGTFLGKVTNWSKIILATNALGYDPSNVAGVNFVDLLLGYDLSVYVDAAMCNNILFALDSKGYETTDNYSSDVVTALLSFQDPVTGGFQAWGSVDPDTTGEAILALAPYRDQARVATAIERALAYLSQKQEPKGYYVSWGSNSPWSTGRVLMGVSGLGIDPLGESEESLLFRKSEGNLISGILQFVTNDGGFGNSSESQSDLTATRDCLMGLSAYSRLVNGAEGLFDLKGIQPFFKSLELLLESGKAIQKGDYTTASWAQLAEAIAIGEEVNQNQAQGQITKAINELRSAMANLKKPISIKEGQAQLPEASTGHKQGIEVGGNSIEVIIPKGNQDEIYLEVAENTALPPVKTSSTLNGQGVAMAISQDTLAQGSKTIQLPQALDPRLIEQKLNQSLGKNTKIEQYFMVGATTSITFDKYVKLTFSGLRDSQAAYVDSSNEIVRITKAADAASGSGTAYCYSEGQDLVVMTTHFTNFIVYQSPSGSGGGDSGTADEISITVDGSKAGHMGFKLEKTLTRYDGMTALSALKSVADVRDDGNYVTGINGLFEFDCGAQSGWMYSVGGEFPPYTASNYPLKSGDNVLWIYTLEKGDTGGQASAQKPEAVSPVVLTELSKEVQGAIEKTKKRFFGRTKLSAWEAFALVQGGEKLAESYYQGLLAEVQGVKGDFPKVTDTEKMVLAVTALGHDARDIGGYNLVEAIYNHPDLKKQGNNGLVFALLALDSGDYQVPIDALWTRAKLVNETLTQQHGDGGFALTPGMTSEVDMTAMAIQGLANYQDQPKVQKAINSALVFLSKSQGASGEFGNQGVDNSESGAQVLVALTALGINPVTDERFVKGEYNLFSNLQGYQLPDGSFEHIKGQGSDQMATEQGMLALISLERFLNAQPSVFKMQPVATAPKTEAKGFTDAGDIAPWALEGVMAASSKGLVAGFSDGSFKPGQEVTRAEFLAILARSLEWDTTVATNGAFVDVDDQSWYGPVANTAFAKGLIKGDGQGLFHGEAAITREEMMVMICQAKGLNMTVKATFKDQDQIAPWAEAAMNVGYEKGYLLGNEGYLNPKGQVSREMAAVVVVRALGN